MASIRHIFLSSDIAFCTTNTPSDFTNILAIPLDLRDADYEVSLDEIHIVLSIPILKEQSFTIIESVGDTANPQANTYILKKSAPQNVAEFVKIINNSIPAIKRTKVKFTYDANSYRTSIMLDPNFSIIIPAEWAKIFGFDVSVFNESIQSSQSSDMYCDLHSAYVWCDIIEPTLLGSERSSVIGTIELSAENRSMPIVISKFPPQAFMRTIPGFIQSVRMYIADSHGKPLQLKLGPTTARLTVRRSVGC